MTAKPLSREPVIVITQQQDVDRVRGWFLGRLPQEWQVRPPEVTVDREEVTVVLHVADVELSGEVSDAERSEARAGRAKAFREATRGRRVEVAREAEHRYRRKVSALAQEAFRDVYARAGVAV